MTPAERSAPTIFPAALYHDAVRMIDWLCQVFGCTRRRVISVDDGNVLHATLTIGSGMLRLSSAETNTFPELIRAPRDIGGIGTFEMIVYVAEVDAHRAHALVGGAEIVMAIEDKPYGGRGYSARDPEGHAWRFSSYDPWADSAITETQS